MIIHIDVALHLSHTDLWLQNLYLHVYNSFTYNSSKLETIQMIFNGWMVKLWYNIHPSSGTLLSSRNLNESWDYHEWKKPIPIGYILYDSTYINSWNDI